MAEQPAKFESLHSLATIEIDGAPRTYAVHVPQSVSPNVAAPLLLMFHGGGGTMQSAAEATQFSRYADEYGFYAAYPQALANDPSKPVSFLRNPAFWNVGSGFGQTELRGVDDVAFVRNMLDELLQRYAIDESRVYAAGFSNGAAMALRAGVALCERMAGVAAVAGHLWDKTATLRRPLPLLYMIGAADPIVPPAGGPVRSPWGDAHCLPPVLDTVETWARWCQCAFPPAHALAADGVQRLTYGQAGTRRCVEFYTIAGAGHVWPGGPSVLAERISGPGTQRLNASATICRFLLGVSR